MSEDLPAAAPLFKKRVKAPAKRKHDESSDDEHIRDSTPHLSVAEILRQRRQGRVKRSAIEVPARNREEASQIAILAANNKDESEVDMMKNRFVAQTGQVVGMYDKQMDEYIGTKLAEYRNRQSGLTEVAQSSSSHEVAATKYADSGGNSKPDKLSVTAGKLMEVDLGGSLSRHEEEEAAKAAKPVKARLGRDGKPWRPRKRRNSENLARDALIDSIMKENSLSRFQDGTPTTTTPSGAATPNNDYVDEDRVLENFKSNYQDPERRNARKPPTKEKLEQAKGPKMGGSKNARRAAEEAEKAKTKKT